jgi:hypothetical protein
LPSEFSRQGGRWGTPRGGRGVGESKGDVSSGGTGAAARSGQIHSSQNGDDQGTVSSPGPVTRPPPPSSSSSSSSGSKGRARAAAKERAHKPAWDDGRRGSGGGGRRPPESVVKVIQVAGPESYTTDPCPLFPVPPESVVKVMGESLGLNHTPLNRNPRKPIDPCPLYPRPPESVA